MKSGLKEYVNDWEQELNTDLMTKASDAPLVDYVIDAWKSLEVVKQLHFDRFEYTENESEIDINKHIFKREKGKRKKDKFDLKFVDDDRVGKLTVYFTITMLETDPSTGETTYQAYPIKKSMLIPLQDENGYYTIKGKKYYMLYQMLEKSTYTSNNSVTLKSLMPIAVKRNTIDVEDINLYQDYNKQFTEHFEFFNYDFNLAMSMLGPKGLTNKIKYRDELCKDNPDMKSEILKAIIYHANGFIRAIQNRKKFVYEHPEKIRLTQEIIKHRPDSKIVTFSANTKMAEAIGVGYVYTGKEGKKKNRITLEEFSTMSSGVLNTCKLAEAGMDIPGLSVGIMLGVNSSETKAQQTRGRVIRKEGDKTAEYFTLVINDTIESKWWQNSHKNDSNIIKIDSENLIKVLNGEPYETYTKKLKNYSYRF